VAAALAALLTGCGADVAPGPDETGTTRTVTHALGTSEVPTKPQRVATLSEVVAGHLASTGLLVVAAGDDVPEWLAPYRNRFDPDLDLSSITTVGSTEEPNLETLAAVQPDLIVIETFSETLYDELSQIAPTVAVEREGNGDWQDAFDQTVALTGREEEAESLRTSYAEALAAVPKDAAQVEVSCVRADDETTFRMDGAGAFCGSVVQEAGFTITPYPDGVEPEEGGGFVSLSSERLSALTGDLIVAETDDPASEEITLLTGNSLWYRLPAVRSEAVVTLPNPIYNNGTYYAAEILLEEITAAAADEGLLDEGGS
jgi:iron complex transport system substrate-binding protein